MSVKETCYFSHDANAKDDFKIMLLIEELGLEGYGIFWILIETLREQQNYKYPLKLLNVLARKYNTTLAKVETVVKNYHLFEIEDECFFFSRSLNRRMEVMHKAIEQRKIAGQISAMKRKKKQEEQLKQLKMNLSEEDSSERPSNDRQTSAQQIKEKENKEKENKEKKRSIKDDIKILQSLDDLTANKLALINISTLDLTDLTINFINKHSLQETISLAINNTKYLAAELIKKPN